jgi:hypothetical protein
VRPAGGGQLHDVNTVSRENHPVLSVACAALGVGDRIESVLAEAQALKTLQRAGGFVR